MRIGERLDRELDHVAGQQFVRDDARQRPARTVMDVREVDDIAAGMVCGRQDARADMARREVGRARADRRDGAAIGRHRADQRWHLLRESPQPAVHLGNRGVAAGVRIGIEVVLVAPQPRETRAAARAADADRAEQPCRAGFAAFALALEPARYGIQRESVADLPAQQQREHADITRCAWLGARVDPARDERGVDPEPRPR
ncbi:hypothetical protein ABG067_008540, partial [Albugo candida]